MKLQIPKRIRAEDFKSEDQDMISKVAYIFNDFANSVYQVLNKQIDYDNLNRQLVSVNVVIDSNGAVQNPPQIKLSLVGRIRGTVIINAVNVDNPNIYPTTAPYLSWTSNAANSLTILSISGLQPNSKYTLTVEVIASSN